MKITTIAVDAMGGDHGPPVTIPGSLRALVKFPELHLILVGDQEVLKAELKKHGHSDTNRISIHHASQYVEMDESPAHALRTKKDSSMRVAINLVKQKKAGACVSAGNTGALMATARFVLKTLPGIDRPAIISTIPSRIPHKNIRMLDLGANVDSSVEHLFQFAVMGSVVTSTIDNIPNPKVCLLNIGHEDIKGNELVKQAAQVLSSSKAINYAGYIEGDKLHRGFADVIVCDGFVGNVSLKTMEGTAKFIGRLLKDAFTQNILTKLVGLMAKPILQSIKNRIDPDRYNGASFIGLQGVVIKSHGGANMNAFSYAIEEAMRQAEKNLPERIGSELEKILSPAVNKQD